MALIDLSARQRNQILSAFSRLKVADDEHPAWEPNPGAQSLGYHSQADVLGYGGSAGGGKTDLLLGTAKDHQRASIYRRHYPDLADIVTRGNEIFSGVTSYVSGDKKRWEFPDGKMIFLSAVQHQTDLAKFQGRARDFIAIDEAAEFPENWFRFLTGWLRTTKKGQRTRIVLTFNPPQTPEGEWIIRYFAPWLDPNYTNPAAPGELRYYVRIKDEDIEVPDATPVMIDGFEYKPQSRTFIPARVDDNPFLTSDYKSQLNMLPEPLRSQLLFGDFNIKAKDDPWQVIPTEWVLAAQKRWREMERPSTALRAVASDPSRGGDDKHAIAKLYGTYFELYGYPGASTPDGIIAAQQVLDTVGLEQAPIYVDVIGIGASVYDQLKVKPGVQAHPVNNSESARGTDKSGKYEFANVRAASYWKLREALDPTSGENIALPDTREIRIDLTAPRFSVVGGKIKIEPKEDIKKRIGRSPDDGDVIVMAWHGVSLPVPGGSIYF
jgi:hypothetical protein